MAEPSIHWNYRLIPEDHRCSCPKIGTKKTQDGLRRPARSRVLSAQRLGEEAPSRRPPRRLEFAQGITPAVLCYGDPRAVLLFVSPLPSPPVPSPFPLPLSSSILPRRSFLLKRSFNRSSSPSPRPRAEKNHEEKLKQQRTVMFE